ncbi:MAG TPA: hypothetical protein VF009_07835 [Solirubrobacterales bacterium]
MALTKTEYVKQGNDICEKALETKDAGVREAAKGVGNTAVAPPKKKLVAVAEEAILPVYQELTKQLDELPSPVNDKARVERIMADYEAGLERAEANPESLIAGTAFRNADRAAHAYGLKYCTL